MLTATKPGGSSNSHPRATSGPPLAVETGIDTWRLVRYLDDRELDLAARRCNVRTSRGYRCDEPVKGHVVGIAPAHRMLWMEGKPVVDGLARPTMLSVAEDRLLGALDDASWPLGEDGGVARLDQTVTLRFADGREGQTFLAGMAAVDLPRTKPATYGRPPETVYLLAEKSGRKLARVYDKGLESNTAPRGELIRLENQTRYTKDKRLPVMALQNFPIAAETFERRFAPVAESVDGLTAATLPVLVDELRDRLSDGRLSHRAVERLSGYLITGGAGYPATTRKRRRRELRANGLVLANPLEDPIEVDLGQALEEALAAWERER